MHRRHTHTYVHAYPCCPPPLSSFQTGFNPNKVTWVQGNMEKEGLAACTQVRCFAVLCCAVM
jgi:hypothetical protein